MKTKDTDGNRANKKLNRFRSHRRRIRSKGKRKRKTKGAKVFNDNRRRLIKPKTFFAPSTRAMNGNSFWLNYASVFRWKDSHLTNECSSPYSLPGINYFRSQEPVVFTHSQKVVSDCSNSIGRAKFESTYQATEEEPEEDSDDDIVVTEEMMQFLEISMRHKANLRIEKEEAKKRRERELKVERDAIGDCQHPGEEAENEKRLTEMKLLYGEEAPMIHGMETALQLTFNRQVDLFNPPYWPILPFTIQFQPPSLPKSTGS